MNTTAEILRDCAYALPYKEATYQGLFGGLASTDSPYICDVLTSMQRAETCLYSGNAIDKAREFLAELGMPSGLCVFQSETDLFSDRPHTRHHQFARATWLLFAADLAEEWGV